MRTSLLALVAASALALSACSGGSGSASDDPTRSAHSTDGPTASSGSGNPFGEAPTARATFEPVADHDTEAGDLLLYSLDACSVVKAAGIKKVQPQMYSTSCEADYDAKNAITVNLVHAFPDDERYAAERTVVNDVVTYLVRNDDGECDAQMIPTSHEGAIEIEAGYDIKDPCGTLEKATDAITRTLTTDLPSVQSSTLTPANVPVCTLLRQAYGDLADDETIGLGASRNGQCTVRKDDVDYPGLYSVTTEVTIMVTEYPKPVEAEAYSDDCEATGAAWAMPDTVVGYSGERGAQAVIEVGIKGTCDEAKDLFAKILAASKTAQPTQQTLTEKNRFWYTEDEADRPVSGSCATVGRALEIECLPAAEASVPEDRVQAFRAAAVNPDITCAMVKDQVAEHFPDLDQVSTAVGHDEKPACIFSSAGAERSELWVEVPEDQMIGFTDSATSDGVETGPTSAYLPGWSDAIGQGVRSADGPGGFVLTLGVPEGSSTTEGSAALEALAQGLGTEVLSAS